jgi:nitrite reductase/ring-hydroxylating ferredoxin subunit
MSKSVSPEVPTPSACSGCAYSRRDFVSMSAGALAALALAACSSDGGDATAPPTPPPPTNQLPAGVTISGNTVTVDVSIGNDLTEAPGLLFILGRTTRPVLLVKSETGTRASATYRAFNAACPHAGTQNQWQDAGADVVCRNHGSQFDRSTGAVTAGLASSGLRSLPISRAGNVLTVNAG